VCVCVCCLRGDEGEGRLVEVHAWTVEMAKLTRLGGLAAQGTMVPRLALVVLALSVTLPMCTSSILPASLGARLESENSLLQLAWSAVSSGLPRLTHSRILLADAAVTPWSLTVSHCGSGVHAR
jgi:hypothetical protein